MNLDQIKSDSILQIFDKKFKVVGKASYNAGDNFYYKIFLSDHYVVNFEDYTDSSVFFGHIVPDLPYLFPFPGTIGYDNQKFVQNCSEHQTISEVFFGNVEGDCDYWDYENGNKIISIAILSESGKRADVYGEIIPTKDIKF